jgi:hypothetical protein
MIGVEEEESAPQPAYAVGYRRPPRHTRFKNGQSGNPKGRRKGSKAVRTLLEQALSCPVAITEAGRTRVVEQRYALIKAMVAKAIKGDVRAARLIVDLMEKFGISHPDGEAKKPFIIQITERDAAL